MKLELTPSQYWILVKALVMLSSDSGLEELERQFPNIELEHLAQDMHDIIDKLQHAKEMQVLDS